MTKLFIYLLFGILMMTYAKKCANSACKRCSSDYPVCATNGTHWLLFKNECRLKWENRKRIKNGSSLLTKTEISNCFKKCDQVCTKEYAPICAKFGEIQETFENRCQLDLENCKTDNIWKIVHEGECPPTPLTIAPPTTDENGCPQFCTLEYKPICATFEDTDQTFQNLCYLQSEMCKSKRNWQIKHEGECIDAKEECDESCPRIYSPICAAFNGENKTFGNECILDLEICKTRNRWEILYKGECKEPAKNCPTICPEIYQPVCGSNNGDLRTFPNKCFFDIESCKANGDWQFEYDGECKESTTPAPCNEICPFYYKPICAAYNGETQTFGNDCFLRLDACKTGRKWKIISESGCPTPETTQIPDSTTPRTTQPATKPPTTTFSPTNCPDVCPAIYDPVCASLGNVKQTFSNNCELGVEICKTGQDWKFISSGPCPNDNPEVTVCPAIYDPICARLNGNLRTFANQCQLDAEISNTNQAWETVGPGDCGNYPSVPTGPCPRCDNLYQPVCGFYNGEQKTFINECQMLTENCYSNKKWVMVYEGECKVSDQPRNCPNICPLKYDPVCATFNGIKRTFPNECELNHEAYKTNSQWVILHNGECDYCPICTNEKDPVCGEYNGQFKTFGNACKMESENCKTGSGWQIVSRSLCENIVCPKFCPRYDKPICAFYNGETRTFSNTCEMNRESCATNTKWKVISQGECPPSNPNCPKNCPFDYNPVCAMYQGVSKSFVNECVLRAEMCNTKKNWLFLHPGPCSNDQPKPVNPVQESTFSTDAQLLAALINRLKCDMRMPNSISYPTEVEQTLPPPPPSKYPVSSPRKCKIVQCLEVYDPVCAVFNGMEQTFPNVCYMKNTNCRDGQNWVIIRSGPCQPRI